MKAYNGSAFVTMVLEEAGGQHEPPTPRVRNNRLREGGGARASVGLDVLDGSVCRCRDSTPGPYSPYPSLY